MFAIKYFDHTADIGFIIKAKTIPELFEGAATATLETMASLKKIKPEITKEIILKSKTVEQLLFDFIEELIFLKDAEYILFSQFKINIQQEKDKFILKAILKGEKINPRKHGLKTDVKAITLHKFELKKTNNSYQATIILDI